MLIIVLVIFAGVLVEAFIRSLNVEPFPAVEGPNYTDHITDPGLFPQGGDVTVLELPYYSSDKWLIHTIMNETEFQQYIASTSINDTSVTYSEYNYNKNWAAYQVFLPYSFTAENYGITTWTLAVVDVNGNEKNMSYTT